MNCPRCEHELNIEDHSIVGGPKEYWVCPNCGEEMMMFGGAK